MQKIGEGVSMPTVIRLSPSTREALEEYCAAQDKSISAVVRDLIIRFLEMQSVGRATPNDRK